MTASTRPSLRAAINKKCCDCVYDPGSGLGGWREQVTQCMARTCPLWAVRPRSKAKACRITPHESFSVNHPVTPSSIGKVTHEEGVA